MIIAFSGYAGSGKDTAANITQWLIHKNRTTTISQVSLDDWMRMSVQLENWKVKQFSFAVKNVVSTLIDKPLWYINREEFQSEQLTNFKMSGRQFIEWVEHRLSAQFPKIWAYALLNQYQPYTKVVKERWLGNAINIGSEEQVWPNWLITDLKTPEQFTVLSEYKPVIMLRVLRKFDDVTKIVELNRSETALNRHEFDANIYNTGTFEDLANELDRFYKSINLYGRI